MVLVLCHLATASACMEKVLVSTEIDPEFRFMQCMGWEGQARLAQWKEANPMTGEWKYDRYRCVPAAHYIPKVPA